MKNQLAEFLQILESETKKTLAVRVSSKDKVVISPLSFKQQKILVTSGLDGIIGVMSFIKNLNDILLYNSGEGDLKIYDRIPLILALRKELSSKMIVKDEVEIDVDNLISKFNKFPYEEAVSIEGDGFQIKLQIPTLTQENRFLSTCVEDLKKLDNDNMGKSISMILSYEIPKFVDCIEFGENSIKIGELSIGDRNKIMDNLPATITNQITDFILKVRSYDDDLLTYDGTTIDIDYSFFE